MPRFIDEKIRELVIRAEEEYLASFAIHGAEVGVIPSAIMVESTIRKIVQFIKEDGYVVGVYDLGEIVSNEEKTLETEIPVFSPEELAQELEEKGEVFIDRLRYYFNDTYTEWEWEYLDITYIVNKPRNFNLGDKMILFALK